ncbi:MAG: hypothetical protein MUO21_02410, partial [Nitrososphaeraceae archaeon]|nr:hypothetical protein [Nitrososphaeraceae archaeon]
LSQYLHNPDNELISGKINKILADKKLSKDDKKNKIKYILYKITDKSLSDIYERIKQLSNQNQTQTGGKYNKLVHVITKLPDLSNYTINNNRDICTVHKTKGECDKNLHCHFSYDECHFALTKELLIKFINKVSDELTDNDHKTAEILQKEGYFVSDIADYNNYEERKGQKIIKSANNTINKVLAELFGKENIPVIGKRRFMKVNTGDIEDLHLKYPLSDMGDYYTQRVIENNLSILRAYANAYIWIKYAYYDIENRNMGYYSDLQTDMANYFRSNIIDWITDKKNYSMIVKDLNKQLDTQKKDFIIQYINKLSSNTNGLIEYYILNKIYNIPVLIYDNQNNVIFIIDNGIHLGNSDIAKKYNKYASYINIKYAEMSAAFVPTQIDALYFK